MGPQREGDDRQRRARPGYHDPTHGIGGAPPARSALTLRLVLAAVGLVACGVWAVVNLGDDGPAWLSVVLVVLAVVAAGDIVVILRRKARGEPG
jgi:cytochrome c biogenesis factor